MTQTASKTSADYGRAIADEIELRGHYQGGDGYLGMPPRCVLTAHSGPSGSGDRRTFFQDVALAAGLTIGDSSPDVVVMKWNDSTPTAQVLETLRSL